MSTVLFQTFPNGSWMFHRKSMNTCALCLSYVLHPKFYHQFWSDGGYLPQSIPFSLRKVCKKGNTFLEGETGQRALWVIPLYSWNSLLSGLLHNWHFGHRSSKPLSYPVLTLKCSFPMNDLSESPHAPQGNTCYGCSVRKLKRQTFSCCHSASRPEEAT